MKKKDPWRIVGGILSILYILFLWVKKEVASVYGSLSPEQLIPVMATSVAVTAIKFIAIAAAVFLIKWIIKKIKTDL